MRIIPWFDPKPWRVQMKYNPYNNTLRLERQRSDSLTVLKKVEDGLQAAGFRFRVTGASPKRFGRREFIVLTFWDAQTTLAAVDWIKTEFVG
jgi:hypothetical protein